MDALLSGMTIALIGIALVFALLALLWVLAAALLLTDRRGLQPEPGVGANGAASELAASTALPSELVAAITVAVLAHGAQQRRQAAPASRSHQPGSLIHASRWVAAGRTRQNRSWPPHL